ncbi:LysR family transcriptional regulator [Erwinia sp. AnSW2-5]|uniref:LysR family transcriptional regulator n=1 Tax=Erwinia sp. AnSW2-5 TaxID=3367692 RepID=UPI003859D9C7
MNLKQLYYFKRLAEKEHYTAAASSLFITQPSLSHAISELEKELGVTLFAKQGRNIRITEEGTLFLPYVEKAIAELENGRAALQRLNGNQQETVNLAYIYTMGERVVPQLIERFSQQPEQPPADFCFFQGTSSAIVQELKADKFDLAICSHLPHESEIEFTPIISQELVLVTSRHHPLAQREAMTIDLHEAMAWPFVFFSEKSGLRPFIDRIFSQKNLTPKIACYVEEDTAMVGLVSINYGIAIMPRITTLDYSDVKVMSITDPGETRYIYLATRKDRQLSPVAKAFKQFIIQHSQSELNLK